MSSPFHITTCKPHREVHYFSRFGDVNNLDLLFLPCMRASRFQAQRRESSKYSQTLAVMIHLTVLCICVYIKNQSNTKSYRQKEKKKTETSRRGYRYSGTLIQTHKSHHSESESIDRYSRGLTERFWRGNENGLSDRCLLAFSCFLSLIPRSNDAASKQAINTVSNK